MVKMCPSILLEKTMNLDASTYPQVATLLI
jgi:hypothetical protein